MNIEDAYLRWLGHREARAWQRSANVTAMGVSIKRCCLIVLRGMATDSIAERAGYMTYFSLLYMIPLAALMLALAETLGLGTAALEFMARKLSVTAPELAADFSKIISELDFVAIGLIAFIFIVIAGFAALVKLESIVDDIWVACERRPFWRTLAMYPLLIIVAPTVAALVLAITAVAKSQTESLAITLPQATRFGELVFNQLRQIMVLIELMPSVLIIGLLTLANYVVPSDRVRWQSAVTAGVTAGVAWLITQGFYLNFQFATSTFRAAWGYLAQVPLLLLWIYASWLIALAGVELCFAWQHRNTYLPKYPVSNFSPEVYRQSMLEVIRMLIRTREERPGGLSSAEISNRLRLPWALVRLQLTALVAIDAAYSDSCQSTFKASEKVERWTIGELMAKWRASGEDLPEAERHMGQWEDQVMLAETLAEKPSP